MIPAQKSDKEKVKQILIASFNDNPAINFIVKKGSRRDKRLENLMDYAFDVCLSFGEVFLSDDKTACALILFPEQRKGIKSLLLDLRLVFNCMGLPKAIKVAKREKYRKNVRPSSIYYLWFIGVDPKYQGQGIGTKLMHELIDGSREIDLPLYLETTVEKNVGWYEQLGLSVFHEAQLHCKFFFLRSKT
jgi:ribosomal protein S18 acetylase RimI-like enzyme